VARQLACAALRERRSPRQARLASWLSDTPGERVLIVDDVLTAGTSIREVTALAPFSPTSSHRRAD
jgi:orotate phosphoribosyltransferase